MLCQRLIHKKIYLVLLKNAMLIMHRQQWNFYLCSSLLFLCLLFTKVCILTHCSYPWPQPLMLPITSGFLLGIDIGGGCEALVVSSRLSARRKLRWQGNPTFSNTIGFVCMVGQMVIYCVFLPNAKNMLGRVRIQVEILVGKFLCNGRQVSTCLHNTRVALVLDLGAFGIHSVCVHLGPL
jgi:hypothetical protein